MAVDKQFKKFEDFRNHLKLALDGTPIFVSVFKQTERKTFTGQDNNQHGYCSILYTALSTDESIYVVFNRELMQTKEEDLQKFVERTELIESNLDDQIKSDGGIVEIIEGITKPRISK